ncbi:hypothetical protein SUGI_0389830 [Cryptomeria japonica]|nr:hypothetical protein SUGI_0389830 [Cryptomeria japonica]
MAALDGSRIDTSDRSRATDVRYSGAQSTKVGSWSDEADIAFPIETSRLHVAQKPINVGKANMFQGNKYSRPQLNYGNPYSSGNQCPIDPHKWKENGFIWNNKGWFRKAKHLASKAPRNWYPPPESSIFGTALERGNPHFDSFLVPLTDHGNFQKKNGRFRQDNSRVDHARFWRSNFRPKNWNPWSNPERYPDFRRGTSLPQRPHLHKPVIKTSRPTIFLDENKINAARSNLLEFCLFIKWGGGKRVKDNFESWCRAQWGKDININILSNDLYMIKFMSNEEKWQAKTKGPYILDGIEVHIIDWQPNFNPRTHVLLDIKLWIRLYNCPSNYWHIDVIKDICKDLGTFVSADDILEDKLWGSFLRICISTDQITKIPDEVRIIGAGKIWIQKIDREDQLHICPKCFSLDHTGFSFDVLATIQRSYSCMKSPIEVKLQLEPPISTDTGEDFCNDTLDKENVPLKEATPLIIVPPSSGQSESQQDLFTLLEKTKTLQADIGSKLADSLPPYPFVPRNQLVIEDGNFHSQGMETSTLGEMGGKIFSSIGIGLEDGEIETSSSEGEEDFEPDSDLILEVTSKGFGKSDSTIDKPNYKPKGVQGRKSKKCMLVVAGVANG